MGKKDKSKKAKKLMKNAKKMMKKANKKEKELTSLQARALHAMRRQGRDDPDAELGRRANWLSADPDEISRAGAPSAEH